MFDFIGKKILITGASGGIGKELTKSFLENGADVFITGTSSQKLTLLNKELNGKCKTIECNLSSVDETNKLIEYLNGFGGMDILINNAGKTEDNLFMRMTDKQWEDVMLINLTSVMRLTRGVIRGMIKKRWGRIINISSVSAKQPIDNLMLSNGVRMSIHGWAKTLSNQVASENILINNVCPGFTHTEFHDQMGDFKSSIPSFMWMDSKTVARQAFNETMKGKDLFINGGVNKFLAFLMWLTPKWLTDLYYALIMRKRP